MDSVWTRAFIDDAFRRAYGVENAAGYTDHLTAHNSRAGCAALGYRRAARETLFLERYLNQPVEQVVSAAFDRKIERDGIVEIGNLAANNAWSMIALWGEAANDLGESGEIVVATLTRPLRRMFDRVGVPIRELAAADPARLGAAASDWGSYYLADPRVCAGSIAEGQRAITAFLARRRREQAA